MEQQITDLLNKLMVQNQRIWESQKQWLTDKEVAERFQTSKDTVRRWRDNHNLPFSQIGEVRRYSTQKVDAWFAKFSPSGISSEMSEKRKQILN